MALWKEHLWDLYRAQPRAGWTPGHTESAFGGLVRLWGSLSLAVGQHDPRA